MRPDVALISLYPEQIDRMAADPSWPSVAVRHVELYREVTGDRLAAAGFAFA